ncbi:MAG TPA: long-chain fatty acid--CoA ligase [Acidimicrobiales bacterium]
MQGLMQDFPLTLPHLHWRAEKLFFDKGVVTVTATGKEYVSYGDWAERTRRLGGVLDQLGISADGRVATFGWNTARHLELYFAAPCTNRVLHALNIRLFPEQLVYVVNHAEDEVVFIDKSLAALAWPLFEKFDPVRHIVVLDDGAPGDLPDPPAGKEVHDYEELLAGAEPVEFHVEDENQAASMCYTSGTTGNPKGVVYSHRSTVLHTMGVLISGLGPNERDRILPVVPMFHANAWGLAHAAVACGADLIMPGPDLSPGGLAALIESERVTIAAGVPTIWMGVLPELKGRDVSSLRAIPCGGSAVPRSLSEAYREQIGLPIMQAWGMTETSPVASSGEIKSTLAEGATEDELADRRTTVGIPLLGVEARIAPPDGTESLPWDGQTQGELQVRGPWVAKGYYNDPRSADSFTEDGWLKTGDVATIDRHGYIRLVDRTKDVIKSGGEWISSVDLENEIMAHPKVAEAAVIGLPHAKWGERPLACVVLKPGEEATKEDIVGFLEGRVAKWWLPDDVVFVDEVPKTSVGKFSKKDLRDRFSDYRFPTE